MSFWVQNLLQAKRITHGHQLEISTCVFGNGSLASAAKFCTAH